MDELKNQLKECQDEAFWTEHNRSFFYENCIKQIEKEGCLFESTKEIIKLSKELPNT